MKKKKYLGLIAIVAIAAVLAAGCVGNKTSNAQNSPTSAITKHGASEFFPIDPGTEWSYKIDIGAADPKLVYTIVWDTASGQDTRTFTDSYLLSEKIKAPECCYLKIKVENVAYRDEAYAVKLNVTRDDLGVYERFGHSKARDAYWIVADNADEFIASKIVSLPAGDFSIVSPDMTVLSLQLLFFDPKNGIHTRKLLNGDPLELIGYDNDAPGCGDDICMHFVRTPRGTDIAEDIWYAPGKGLVRLEQRVNGEPSMTWTLENVKINQ